MAKFVQFVANKIGMIGAPPTRRHTSAHFLTLAEEHFTGGLEASKAASRIDQILCGTWGIARVAKERGNYARAQKLVQAALDRYGYCGAPEVAELQELLDKLKRRTTSI